MGSSSSSNSHLGYGRVVVSDAAGGDVVVDRTGANLYHENVGQLAFEAYVRSAGYYMRYGATMSARVAFRRHGPGRPYIPGLRHRQFGHFGARQEVYRDIWDIAQDYSGNNYQTQSGGIEWGGSDTKGTMERWRMRTAGTGAISAAVGSLSMGWDPGTYLGFSPNNLVTGSFGTQAVSETDVPGTTIGNVFKHPYGRGYWFNEVNIIPLSQGQVVFGGQYSPPENLLCHRGYQVYFAKSGGTGVIQGPVKTGGSTSSASPARFTDTSFAGFTSGDVGKYIAVHGRGIYLITAFIDASNVDTDAVSINEPFASASGITWTLRTGPIAEYFFRSRPYFLGDFWNNNIDTQSSCLHQVQTHERFESDVSQYKLWTSPVYDGYGHWWSARATENVQLGLARWLHHSTQPMQACVADGVVPGLVDSGWSSNGFTAIERDAQKCLWIGAYSTDASKLVLARVDPAPGGNALTASVLGRWRRQQNDSDAGGLTSSHSGAFTITSDNTFWVMSTGGSGGLSYTPDNGVTWKRVHLLANVVGSGNVTVTSTGTDNILTANQSVASLLAAGDWVRVTGDTRSYEVASVSGTQITLTQTYPSAVAGIVLQRGGLNANQYLAKSSYGTGANYPYEGFTETIGSLCDLDHDSQGRLFWISSTGHLCRWDPSTGQCVSFADSVIPALSGSLSAIQSGRAASLAVSRVPNVAGSGVHPFHDDIWIGLNRGSSGFANGGWVRVIGGQWSSSPASTAFTRYSPGVTTNFTGDGGGCVVSVPTDAGNTTEIYGTAVRVEPETGRVLLLAQREGDTNFRCGYHWLLMTGSDPGSEYWRAAQNHIYWAYGRAPAASMYDGRSANQMLMRFGFDGLGMGISCRMSGRAGDSDFTYVASTVLESSFWRDGRWTGSQWLAGLGVGNSFNDINFRGVGAANTANMTLGAGLRRVHEWPAPIDNGLTLTFTQSGGGVAQTDEFLADESSTCVCYIGSGKDNTQTMRVEYRFYTAPTRYRLNSEPARGITNTWTAHGGVDGGYTSSNSGTLGAFLPPFTRGVAVYDQHPTASGGTGYPYPNLESSYAITSANAVHTTACLRCPDIGEFTGDGSISAGLTSFTSSGAYVFTSADVGRSIFIEGANAATVDVDNGQAVIMSVTGPTSVVTDKVFSANRSGLRWKLRDVPAVGVVEIGWYSAHVEFMLTYCSNSLWASSDYGGNWSLVRYTGQGTEYSAGGPLWPDGVYASGSHGYQPAHDTNNAGANAGNSPSIFFDLRSLPSNVRRRQYWRHRVYDNDNGQQYNNWRFAGFRLYDDNFRLLNRPSDNKISDADVDGFQAGIVSLSQIVRGSGSSATPVDDGDGNGLTNTVTIADGLHEDSGSGNGVVGVLAPSSSIDPLFGNVTLLMSMNGANNGTTFLDSANLLPLSVAGNAKTSTAQSVFGGSSAAFDGSGDTIFNTQTSCMAFASADFCVEAWVRLTAMPTSDAWPTSYSSHFVIVTDGTPGSAAGTGFMIGQTKLILHSNDVQIVAATHGMVTGTWYHVAVSRQGSVFRLFVNGTEIGSSTSTAGMSTGNRLYVGSETGEGAWFNGFIDDLRVTRGAARYTSAFSVPSAPHPAAGGTAGTVFSCPAATFTRTDIGKYIRVSGASVPGNNGMALITGYVSATEVATSRTFVPESGVSWSLTAMGPGDKLRLVSTAKNVAEGADYSDVYFTIADVPGNTTITVDRPVIQHPLPGAATVAWDIGRDLPLTNGSLGWYNPGVDRLGIHCVSFGFGTQSYSEDLEFTVVQRGSAPASTPADDDGDGRTDVLTLSEPLTSFDGPVAGDYVKLSHPSYGERVFEIKAITGSDPSRSLILAYDEMLPGLTQSVTWQILRRRGLQSRIRRMVVVGDGVELP